jgi:hypothetical protein
VRNDSNEGNVALARLASILISQLDHAATVLEANGPFLAARQEIAEIFLY